MNFISLTFVFLFPVVLCLYFVVPGKYQKLLLLVASYVFYLQESSYAGLLLVFTTLFTYMAGRAIERSSHKKAWLLAAAVVCIGLLIGLKYTVPPVGISFYTFQTLSYVIDVYRGEIPAEKDLFTYALFVAFFPQLVAGPIERAGDLLGQLKQVHTVHTHELADGCFLLLRGFYKKVVVADHLAVYVDRVYAAPQQAGGPGVIFGTVCFAIQIYCDFSGYTDIARGAAGMMGIRLMENFRHPYRAVNIQDFWRRWHISLTKWFTDYIYVPLGGSRKRPVRHCLNVLFIFLLSGFWHGAALHYVIWGLLHGVYMVFFLLWRRLFPAKQEGAHPVVGWLVTMLLVDIAWVFFRAPSVGMAWTVLKQPFVHPAGDGLSALLSFLGLSGKTVFALFVILLSWGVLEQIPEKVTEQIWTKKRLYLAAAVFVGMVTVIEFSWLSMMAAGGENAFLYFRF